MIQSETQEILSVARHVFEDEFGARASYREVLESVIEHVASAAHLREYTMRKGLRSLVSDMFKQRDVETGLPFAPIANDRDEHVAVPLMSFEEHEFVIQRYLLAGDAQYAQARRVGRNAYETFGRSVVIDGVDYSAAERVS